MKTFFNIHFTELKFHFNCFFILYCLFFIIIYIYNDQVLFLFLKPLITINILNHFIFININELILLKLTISNCISLFLIFYIFILQFWIFNLPGLKKIENFYILKFIFIYISLSIMYNYFLFKIIIPTIFTFFIQFQINSSLINIFFEPRIYNFIKIFFDFIFLFFCIFNYLFCFIILLTNIKKITLLQYRKFIYFKILVLAVFISPPDIFSQFLISFFIISIFESLIFFKFFD